MTGAVGFGSLRFFYGGKYMGNNIRGMLQCLGNPVYGFPCYIVLAALAVCVSSWLGYKGAAGGLLFSLLLCFPAWEDWNTRLISDAWSLALLGLGLIWQPFDGRRLLFSYAVLAAFWLILYACKRGGAGMGMWDFRQRLPAGLRRERLCCFSGFHRQREHFVCCRFI